MTTPTEATAEEIRQELVTTFRRLVKHTGCGEDEVDRFRSRLDKYNERDAAQRLSGLKGEAGSRIAKVEELLADADETERDVYLYCLSELKPILQLIEEVRDE